MLALSAQKNWAAQDGPALPGGQPSKTTVTSAHWWSTIPQPGTAVDIPELYINCGLFKNSTSRAAHRPIGGVLQLPLQAKTATKRVFLAAGCRHVPRSACRLLGDHMMLEPSRGDDTKPSHGAKELWQIRVMLGRIWPQMGAVCCISTPPALHVGVREDDRETRT